MKKLQVLITVTLCFSMMLAFFGCSSTEQNPAENTGEEDVDVPSVAVLLDGPISDMEWNAYAYNGLLEIEEKYGAEISYSENLPYSDMEDVFRSYAEAGYDLIFGHGAQFVDSCLVAAEDYPDTQFCVINGFEIRDNITNITIAQDEMGYLMGVAAALR
jgi:basic membrane protein A